jgi:hypothetical protein
MLVTNRNSTLPQHLGALVFLPILLIACFIYYLATAADLARYEVNEGLFQQELNAHDHNIYLGSVDRITSGDVTAYEVSNDIGIAAIYVGLAWVLPGLVDEQMSVLALVFNCAILVCCYFLHSRICEHYRLGELAKWAFFLNLSLIYFAQLINKDMLTIFAFLLVIDCALNRRMWLVLLLVPVFALVRQQLAIFLLLFLWANAGKRPAFRLGMAYVVTSVAAGFLSYYVSIISEESLEGGFSQFLINFNEKYLIGYLIFNPFRVLQYFFDVYSSFQPFNEFGGLDTAKLLRWPQLVLLTFLLPAVIRAFRHFRRSLSGPERPVVLAVAAFFIVWLMNPTINARYMVLITTLMVILGFCVRKFESTSAAQQ